MLRETVSTESVAAVRLSAAACSAAGHWNRRKIRQSASGNVDRLLQCSHCVLHCIASGDPASNRARPVQGLLLNHHASQAQLPVAAKAPLPAAVVCKDGEQVWPWYTAECSRVFIKDCSAPGLWLCDCMTVWLTVKEQRCLRTMTIKGTIRAIKNNHSWQKWVCNKPKTLNSHKIIRL